MLAQTYPSVEIIVVNDGSTDDTLDRVSQYPGVRCIHGRNSGVATARNIGLRHSTGEYVVFLDHDDRLLPGALESNLRCLREHPDSAFAFGDVQCIDANGAQLPVRSSYDGQDYYAQLLHGSYIWTPGAVMYRRAVLTALSGFDPRMGCVSGYDLNLRITRALPVCYSRTVVLEYRLHEANTSRNNALMLRSEITVLRSQARMVRGNPYHWQALRCGVRFYEDYYGKPLISEVVTNIRHFRHWRQTWTALLVILWYAPVLPARWAHREAVQLLRRLAGRASTR